MPNTLNLKIEKSYKTAPTYGSEFTQIKLHAAVIVCEGTKAGLPTIDLQFTDQDGKQFIALVTGATMNMIASALTGATDYHRQAKTDIN